MVRVPFWASKTGPCSPRSAIVAGVLGSLLAAGEAEACSFGPPYEPQSVRCDAPLAEGEVHTSVAEAEFDLAEMSVERSRYAPPGGGDCGELGFARLQFQWGEGDAWPSDVGLFVTVEGGSFPWIEPSNTETRLGLGWVLRGAEGNLRFMGPEDPFEPIDVSLAVRTIDCEGALSAPLTLRITDPGRSPTLPPGSEPDADDAGAPAVSHCAIAQGPSRPSGGAWLGLGVVALALRRMRAAAAWARRRRWPLSAALAMALLLAALLLVLSSSEGLATRGSAAHAPAPALERVLQLVGLRAPLDDAKRSASLEGLGSTVRALQSEAEGSAPGPTSSSAAGSSSAAASMPRAAPGMPLDGPSTGEHLLEDIPHDLPRDARVAGRVLDATGGPIAGARLQVYFADRARTRRGKTASISTTPAPDAELSTDADGRFEALCPSGRVAIVASAEAYAEARTFSKAPDANIVIVLAPGARVSGRVQRSDGSPVGGARLQLRTRGIDRFAIEGASDQHGAFSIGGVPAGVVEVTASALGLSSAREWLRLALAEDSAPVVFTLTAAHSVYGSVLAPDGSPCAGGVVRAGQQLGSMTEIGSRGQYRLDGLDQGAHELSASCLGVAEQTKAVTFGADTPTSVELNWQLEAGFTVTGSLRTESGNAVEGAMILPYGVAAPDGSEAQSVAASMGASCSTDQRGKFECGGLRAGWYRLRAGSVSGAQVSSDPVRVDAESRPDVALILPASGEVRVRVVGRSPTSGGGPNGLLAGGVFAHGASPTPIPASPRGEAFVFEHLPLGRYRVAFGRGAPEAGSGAADVALAEPGQIIEVELRAPDAMTIGGTVIDPSGEAVPDAWVHAAIVDANFPLTLPIADPVLTSNDGRFEIGDLLPGRYALSAVHVDGEAQKLDVLAGERDVRLVVTGYGSLSGSVTLADGQPANGFAVYILRDTPSQPLGVDGERGSWAMPWVAAGDYRIVFTAASGGATTNARVVSGKETKLAVRLDPKLVGSNLYGAAKRPR